MTGCRARFVRLIIYNMGNDGGTIIKPTRKTTTIQQTTAKDEEYTQITTCHILGLHLQGEPLVVDRDGHVYLKHKLLEAILDKRTKVKYKHTRPLNFKWENARIKCPVTNDTTASQFALLLCGCVISTKALAGLKTVEVCPKCNKEVREEPLMLGGGKKKKCKPKSGRISK